MKHTLVSLILYLIICAVGGCSHGKRINYLGPLSSSIGNEQNDILIFEDSINDILINNANVPYTIHIPLEPQYINLDTVFSSYDFIPLEISEKCVIGNITKIITCNNCFCILDRNNKNVFIFEKDGRFRCRLGDIGHGPKEHIDAWNIAYNDKDETIALLDLEGRKIQHFSLEGKFLNEQSLYLLFTTFEYLEDDIILYTRTSYNKFSDILDLYQLVVTDSKLKPVSRGCKTTNNIRQEFSVNGLFKKYDNKVLYDNLLSDTIWSVNRYNLLPFLVMDIEGKRKFEEYEKLNMTNYLYNDRNNKNTEVFNWFITPKYISMLYDSPKSGGPVQNLIYSRESGLSKIIGFNQHQRRLGDYLANAGVDGVLSDDSFIKIVQPYSIFEATLNQEIKKNLTTKEEEMIKELSFDGNPVLMIEKLIEF